VKITILYDNNAGRDLKSGWGFACLIENKKSILFDTGNSGSKLIHNMKKLGIEPKVITTVVISHNHWDHTGGLKEFIKLNNNVKVIRPKSFSTITEISPGVYSTGALGTLIKEQSLLINTAKGNIVVTGCAHPGLENIIKKAEQIGKIHGIVGGFHGFSRLEKLQGMGLIAPCHCTRRKPEIKQKYPAQFMEIMVGSIIEI
jgi:7,8-dihydropterin-6-yl-methyl-4-(beta-D-ribofuranosyl)aminobenzene 5'-phosphate synthase